MNLKIAIFLSQDLFKVAFSFRAVGEGGGMKLNAIGEGAKLGKHVWYCSV